MIGIIIELKKELFFPCADAAGGVYDLAGPVHVHGQRGNHHPAQLRGPIYTIIIIVFLLFL